EYIQHGFTLEGAVAQRVGHQRHRLDGGMHRQLVFTASPKTVQAGIGPQIGTRSSMGAELERVAMCRPAHFVDEYQLMLAVIEGALPGRGLVPNDEVFQLGEHFLARRLQLGHVAPVDTDKDDRAIMRYPLNITEALLQKGAVLRSAHLAAGEREL